VKIQDLSGDALFPNASEALTFWQSFIGLMGKSAISDEEALVFYRTNSIHTFFMRFSIDLIYFDINLKILKITPNLKPWRFSFCPKAYGVIEVLRGEAEAKGVTIGQDLRLVKE